jgi:predicted DsbA family dithiol-disulfide isomerase
VYVPYVKTVSERSKNSALAAYAAWDQGKFWEMHDLLFERAPDIGDRIIQELARELGLDMEMFKESMESERNTREIKRINDLLWDLGYDKTPTVIVNGEVLSGARNYNQYRSAIETALATSGER